MLRGMGAAMALPLLDVMAPTSARAASVAKSPVRSAYLYFPNGVADGCWAPEKVGADGSLLKLNKWMSPLEPFKEDIILTKNVHTPHGNGHGAGTATWLTGGSYDGALIDAGGVSVDQLMAKQIGQDTVLPSLELSTKGQGYFSRELARNNISWSKGNLPCAREIEPRAVFDRMFRAGEGGADRSVIDLVMENAKRLENRASRSDKDKIAEYLDAVRSIERRIEFAESRSTETLQAGELTDSLVRPDPGIPSDHDEYVKLMMDMMVLAFWADATRVSTFMLDHGQSNRYFNFIDGVQGTWHALSHYEDASGNTEDDDGVTSWSSSNIKRDQYSTVVQWHTAQVAYFLDRLKNINEGDGTLLDHSMILYGSSLSDGNEHGEDNLPLVLAGRGGNAFKTGREVAFEEQESLSGMHLAMLRQMGVQVESFADSEAPMSNLYA
jgi:hypothetical protein